MSEKGGWTETVDSKTGKTYYYNKATKAVQWKKPADFDGDAASAPASKPAETSAASQVAAVSQDDDPENNPAFWAEVADPKSGRKYFYNKKTKKTSWKRPPCMPAADADTPAAASTAAPAAATGTTATAAAATEPAAAATAAALEPLPAVSGL